MKNTVIAAIGVTIAVGVTTALVTIFKDSKVDKTEKCEEELAEIQAHHDAEMAALEEENNKNEREHQKRIEEIQSEHDAKISKMEMIREELLKNVDLCKGASPEEISVLLRRNDELMKKLHEIVN